MTVESECSRWKISHVRVCNEVTSFKYERMAYIPQIVVFIVADKTRSRGLFTYDVIRASVNTTSILTIWHSCREFLKEIVDKNSLECNLRAISNSSKLFHIVWKHVLMLGEKLGIGGPSCLAVNIHSLLRSSSLGIQSAYGIYNERQTLFYIDFPSHRTYGRKATSESAVPRFGQLVVRSPS
mmetsp:Transcript_38359/g.64317  ORF Transcript_38359/g.64317 Transcript_38359/m.64317 type:complete len:182 (-) Transcript_38359:160-705(-)